MMSMVVMSIGRQMVRDGPVRLEFPTAQSLRQRYVSDADGLPVTFGQHRMRDARWRKHGPMLNK